MHSAFRPKSNTSPVIANVRVAPESSIGIFISPTTCSGSPGSCKAYTIGPLRASPARTTRLILFNGQDITLAQSAQIARRGIVRSFQISATFPHLTVLENVRIALQRSLGTSFHFWRSERTLDKLNERALQLLETVGLKEFAGF